MLLEGRTALVTGGSRGIGRAIALALAEEGADVAINYVSSEATARSVADQVQKLGRRVMLAQADVADYPDTYRMAQDVLKEFGHVDILVNNAGITSDKSFVKMDHASWRRVLAINLDGVFNCTKVFIDQMLKQSFGRVVNITSVIGQIGNFGQANYAVHQVPGQGAGGQGHHRELRGAGLHRDRHGHRHSGEGARQAAGADSHAALREGGGGGTRLRLPLLQGWRLRDGGGALHQRGAVHVGRAEEHPVL